MRAKHSQMSSGLDYFTTVLRINDYDCVGYAVEPLLTDIPEIQTSTLLWTLRAVWNHAYKTILN